MNMLAGSVTTIPRNDLTEATLAFPHGLENLRTRADSTGDDLLVLTTGFAGRQPQIDISENEVAVRYPRGLEDSGEIVLAQGVGWSVEVSGGIAAWTSDLVGAVISGFRVSGGIRQCELSLPAPGRQIDISIHGGVADVSIVRPSGVGANLTVHGGVADLEFDDQNFAKLGGQVDLETKPDQPDSGIYHITVSGGAKRLRVTNS